MNAISGIPTAIVRLDRHADASGILDYIRDLLSEMGRLSPAEAGTMLPYLIEMARLEADQASTRLQARLSA